MKELDSKQPKSFSFILATHQKAMWGVHVCVYGYVFSSVCLYANILDKREN